MPTCAKLVEQMEVGMAIRQSVLKAAKPAFRTQDSYTSVQKAASSGRQTAFLCHSHIDRELAEGLQEFLRRNGWDLYIDWQDTTMPDSPNAETANRIKAKIGECYWFIFLATRNSVASRWCPWEIGVADKAKGPDKVVIVPTEADDRTVYGNEYLQLYSSVDMRSVGNAYFYTRDGLSKSLSTLR